MDKRMHVRRRDIVLLVPRGRRQHDIGVECRARHAEVDVDEQVELALGSAARLLELLLLAPLDLRRARRALFLGKDRVLRAEQVLVEEVVALGRRAEQVRRPDEEVAREVLRSIRVLCRELQALVLEGIHDVLLEVLALRLRFVRQLLAALVERRVRRQPAEASGHDVVVGRMAVARARQWRDEILHVDLVAAPLVRREVVERRRVLQARRCLPVRGRHDARPALCRTQLLLADVMRPAAAIAALRAREEQEVEERAVDNIGMVPVVNAAAHDDHRLAIRLDGVVGEFAGRVDASLSRHARVLLLPFRRVRHILVVRGSALAAEAAVDRVVGERQVVDRRDEDLAILRLDALGRHHAADDALLALIAEIWELDLDDLVELAEHRELRHDLRPRIAVFLVQVPLLLVVPAVAHRAIRHDEPPRELIDDVILELRMLVLAAHVLAVQEASRLVAAVGTLLKLHEEREVRVMARVFREELGRLTPVVLVEDDVAHRHGKGGIAADLQRDPRVCYSRRLRVIRCNRDDLCPLVARFDQEMRVRRARQRHVRAPGHDVAGIEPVRGLRHIRLVAPDLRACRRQVGIPVVERQRSAAHELHEARAGRVRQHGLRRDDGEGEVAVRAVLHRRVQKRRGDELRYLVPARAHEAALAARFLIALRLGGIIGDALPGFKSRLVLLARLAPERSELAAQIRILDAVRIVEIPRERRSARAAARLEVRHVRARLRIIVLLVLPSHEPVLDIDVPAARTRAVDTVRRVNALVKRPTVAIGVFPFTAAFKELLMSRRRFLDWDEMLPFCKDIAHVITLLLYLILSDFISHSCDKYHGRTLLRKKNLPRRISRLSSMDSAHSMLQISLPQFSHWMASLR